MPKQAMFGVSAAKYLLKEKRFLLIGGTGLFVVFTLFTSPLFSMIPFTRGIRQLVNDDDNPYYLMQQASAQEENEGVTDEEANTTAEVDESQSTDEPTPVPCEETTAGCPPSLPLPPPSSPTAEPTPQANATALPGENVTAVPQTTTPTNQTASNATANGTTTAANATGVSGKVLCEPVPQENYFLSQRDTNNADVTTADDTAGTNINNYNITTTASSLTDLNQDISNRVEQFEESGSNITAKEQEDLISSLEQRKENLVQLMNENPDAAFSSIFSPEEQDSLNQITTNCVERLVTVEGQFSIFHADYFEQGYSVNEYHLITNSGEDITIHPAYESIENGSPQPGSVVRITGFQIDDQLLFDASSSPSASLTNSENIITGLQVLEVPTFARVDGNLRVVVLLYTSIGQPAPTITVNDLQNVMDEVKNYFSEASYGKVSLSGKEDPPSVVDVFEVDQKCNVVKVLGYFRCVWNTAMLQGIPISSYDRIIHVRPLSDADGLSEIPGDCKWYHEIFSSCLGNNIVINSNQNHHRMVGAIAHELGHTFGMYHASAIDCGDRVLTDVSKPMGSYCVHYEYGDNYDAMGNPKPTLRSGHYDAPHKEFLGWFEPSNVKNLYFGTQNGDYALEPLETATNGLKVLKIHIGKDRSVTLYVEFRQPIGFDAVFSSFSDPASDVYNGATLHVVDRIKMLQFLNTAFGIKGLSGSDTFIIDPTPDGSLGRPSGTPYPFHQSVLKKGDSFTDPMTGITLKVKDVTPSLLTVSVSGMPLSSPPEICLNEIDDDGDGAIDEDPNDNPCVPPPPPTGQDTCGNYIDDDGDGTVDNSPPCEPQIEVS
jgi:hypothetical protein